MTTDLKEKLKKFKSSKYKVNTNPNLKNSCEKFAVKAQIAVYLQQGMDIKEAAKLCKITDYQLGVLRSDPEFEEFVSYCSSECEFRHLENIDKAGTSGQWQASAWVLERKFPDKYGKKDTIRHEYELKLFSFQKIMLGIINELDPNIRHQIMQKLRSVNLESEMHDISIGETKGLNSIAMA